MNIGKLLELSGDDEAVVASLPQKNNAAQKILRMAELKTRKTLLTFKIFDNDPSKIPQDRFQLPLSDMSKAVLLKELESLRTWIKGQIENRLELLTNEAVWKSLSRKSKERDSSNATRMERIAQVLHDVKNSETYSENSVTDNVLGMFAKLGTPANQQILKDSEFEVFTTFSSYTNSYAVLDPPEIAAKWMDDKVFASQRLAGLNPMAIKRVTLKGEEPGVGVAWEDLQKKLSPKIDQSALSYFGLNLNLNDAVKQRRLFVCDYEALVGIKPDPKAPGVKQDKLLAPVALYIKSDNYIGLQLIAIQLDQSPESDVLLAKDKNQPGRINSWLMAKMIVQISDVNYNQAVNHLLETHLIEDAFATTTRRQLAHEHPLRVLLLKHFTALLMINKAGEKLLLSDSGLIQQILETGLSGALQLMKERYDTWSFDDLDFPARLKARGVDDPESLPYFPYRDDGKLLWDVLGRYVGEYIRNYYESDEDVQEDYELQAWALELSENVKGIAPAVKSIAELQTILHRIIWTAGPQHAAVNFPQIEYFGFVPNYPTAFYAAPPQNLSTAVISNDDLLNGKG